MGEAKQEASDEALVKVVLACQRVLHTHTHGCEIISVRNCLCIRTILQGPVVRTEKQNNTSHVFYVVTIKPQGSDTINDLQWLVLINPN